MSPAAAKREGPPAPIGIASRYPAARAFVAAVASR